MLGLSGLAIVAKAGHALGREPQNLTVRGGRDYVHSSAQCQCVRSTALAVQGGEEMGSIHVLVSCAEHPSADHGVRDSANLFLVVVATKLIPTAVTMRSVQHKHPRVRLCESANGAQAAVGLCSEIIE